MYATMIVSGGRLGMRPTLVISEVALVLPGLALVALLERPVREALALRPVRRGLAILSVLSGGSLWALSLGVFYLQYTVWPPPEGYLEVFRRLHQALRPSGPADALVSAFAIAVVPAACEEALFRGIVLGALLPLGRTPAVLASAVLFGLIHLDFSAAGVPALYRTPFAIVVGAVLAVLRLRSGSLVPVVLAHATLNLITFTVAPWVDDPGPGLPPAQPLLGAALLLGGAAVTLIFVAKSGIRRDEKYRLDS